MSPDPRRAPTDATVRALRLRGVPASTGGAPAPLPPPAFAAAVAALRAATPRPDVVLTEVPGPARLAPFSVAFTADLDDDEHGRGEGRFVVLYDPAGQDAWDGPVRVVAFARGSVDTAMADDPLLTDVGWAWLQESLESFGASATSVGGTVTRTASQRFGTMSDQPDVTEIEVRASWSPSGSDLADALPRHLLAWAELLCATAGLPPPGTATLRRSAD